MPGTTSFIKTAMVKQTDSNTTNPTTPAEAAKKVLTPTKMSQTTQKIIQSTIVGMGIMTLTTPGINALNQISVYSCRFNRGFINSIKDIFYGNAYGTQPSLANFGKGVFPHYFKETIRTCCFKAVALANVKPWLEKQESLTPMQRILALGGGLALAEGAIVNPVDTARVRLQGGKPIVFSLQALYSGTLGNIPRQFFTWTIWGATDEPLNSFLLINTDVGEGLVREAVKSPFQALAFTSAVYPIERLKNKLQYDHESSAELKRGQSRYAAGFRSIVAEQGVTGLVRGGLPKLGSNTLLVFGANLLTMWGKKAGSGESMVENIKEGFKGMKLR